MIISAKGYGPLHKIFLEAAYSTELLSTLIVKASLGSMVVVQSLSCLRLLKRYGPQPARFLCLWDSPGKNTGVGCHFLLQGICPTQELNLGLLHCRQILPTELQGKPFVKVTIYSIIWMYLIYKPSIDRNVCSIIQLVFVLILSVED